MPVAVTLPEPWSRSRLSVVVPTYNEAENLPVLVEQVLALPLPELRLVVVDDNSPDAPVSSPTSLLPRIRGGSRSCTAPLRTGSAGPTWRA